MNAVIVKQKTAHALVAQAVRAELKKMGVVAKVQASKENVNVTTVNLAPRIAKQIKTMLQPYEKGYFDGMTDMYVNNNLNGDIPQVRYTQLYNGFDNEFMQKAYDILLQRAPDWFVGVPNTIEELRFWHNDIYGNGVEKTIINMLNGENAWSKEIWSKEQLDEDYRHNDN